MNYQNLFQDADHLDGGENMSCFYYCHGGETALECPCRYPMLFVLEGSLELYFKYSHSTIEAGNVVVIDPQAMQRYSPSAETVVLAYIPPRRLDDLFSQCSHTFDSPYSQIVPILPPLQEWIDVLLARFVRGEYPTGEQAHEQRKELSRIFMAYPRRALGELYAAFSACALGDCEKCQQGVFEHGTQQLNNAI